MSILAQRMHGWSVVYRVAPSMRDAVHGRLDDGVLLGVDGAAELVTLAGGDAELSRRQPTSRQWAMPRGAPL